MSAKPKKAAKPKEETVVDPRVDAGPGAVPSTINDVRADDEPVLGHFVEIVKGENKGRYGVFEEVFGDTGVVRTRDADMLRLTCPLSDMVPALAGRR